MIRFPIASASRRILGLPGGRKGRPRRRAPAGLEALEARTVLSTYTMPLVNHSLLAPAKYSIYVGGFSNNNLTLQPSAEGVLGFATTVNGTWSTYEVGSVRADDHRIQFDSSQFIDGARIYFFVVPKGGAAPSYPYHTQPPDPPGGPNLFAYVELTNPNNGARPTVDLSTVDGFSFPMTLGLNDKLGEVGQPLANPHVDRQAVIKRYATFMKDTPGGGMYTVLELPKGSKTDGQSEGLLNPYFYLKETGPVGSLPANVTSPLNTVFDAALNTLFTTSGWSLKASDQNIYTATAGTYQYGKLNNPLTNNPLILPGIRLQGGGNTFTVFNPVGVNVFLGANGQPITTTIKAGQLDQLTLTNPPAAGVLQPGMYVFGSAGFNQANDMASSYIKSVDTTGGQTVVTLDKPLAGVPSPATVQLVFSKVPYLAIMQLTSGAMVFGNAGFFADAQQQGYTLNTPAANTLGNIENQIVSAFNRGVAVVPGASGPLSPSTNGYATAYWGTETNWYPIGQPGNLFSWFLHAATIGKEPIYLRPPGAVADHNGNLMGAAYGFAYDENPGPVPPAPPNQPEVPSKFDPVPAGTTRITITLDPWSS